MAVQHHEAQKIHDLSFFFQWLLFSAIALSDFGAPLKAPCYRQRIAQFSKFDLGKYRK